MAVLRTTVSVGMSAYRLSVTALPDFRRTLPVVWQSLLGKAFWSYAVLQALLG